MKNKNKTQSKALKNVQETLEDINVKLRELIELDKGSKTFAIVGWFLMSLSGAVLITLGVFYNNQLSNINSIMTFFFSSFISVMVMIIGYSLAHKGLTGDWL